MISKFEKITPESVFLNRRFYMKNYILASLTSAICPEIIASVIFNSNKELQEQLTKESVATSYNNFYEFSLEKDEVKKKVEKWNIDKNWKINISGLVEKKHSLTLEELIALCGVKQEERIYRFRCVEGWSMVVPWYGFPLKNLIEKLKLTKNTKFVKFQSFTDKKSTQIDRLPNYPWPYTEGLTLEEALNPLTFIATGMYGKPLSKQNGAPLRLVVPWKYGFKSIKSLVNIEFTENQPQTLWNSLASNEYGFYANVNPNKAHPRWSQATERILDTSFFPKRKPTLMFNGYEKEVSYLYKNLDLLKNF